MSCGASLQAVYEGDVRFEHCMALDAQPEVKPTIRRACWEEWRRFYTFGQTRDRTEYAALRERQLSVASDFDEGDAQLAKAGGPSGVDPTSALAPPPRLIAAVDADAADALADAPPDADVDAAAPGAACSADCEQARSVCRGDCKGASCEKACSSKYKRCMKRCF